MPISRRAVLAGAAGALPALSAPWVARADANTLRIGVQTILSGAIALLGSSTRNALSIEVERINAAGGLGGRKIELVIRDSKGQPQEAARVARELVNSDGVELLIDSEASSGSFAVQEVVRDLNMFCIHTATETSSLTADPKIRAPTAFRCARQGIHDGIVGSDYAARIAEAQKLTRWATCSPDYAFGRDVTAQYLELLKAKKPDIEIVTQAWPKLGQPDFNEVITKLLQAKPQALFSLLYAGDISAFINQSSIYGLFSNMTLFNPGIGDYPVLQAVKNLPKGIQTGTRYLENFPDTPGNKEWGEAYHKRFGEYPTNWSWQATTAMMFLEAATKKAGSTKGADLAQVMPGLTIDCPFGVGGKITMREDHTLVNYAIGWGKTTPAFPYVVDIEAGDWGKISEQEAEWKKRQGWA